MKLPILVSVLLLLSMSCKSQPSDKTASGIYDPTNLLAQNAHLSIIREGFLFTEGPAADAEGNIYFTDQPNDAIWRWDAGNGQTELYLKGSDRANGLYIDRDGHIISCADMHGEIRSINIDGPTQILLADFRGQKLNGPNDLWESPDGIIYFTDPYYRRDYWHEDDPRTIQASQKVQGLYMFNRVTDALVLLDSTFKTPNGIIGTPDDNKLYVADIADKKTYVYHIGQDGYLYDRALFCEMHSDGMTIDRHGNVYLTNEQGVTAFDPAGKKILNIPIPEPWTANVTIGGTDRKTLFITAMSRVYGIEMR